MKWMLVIMFLTPGGDTLYRSYTESSSLEMCMQQRERILASPHPYGLNVKVDCIRASITHE